MEVVQLHSTSLRDVPGRLRRLADRIEAGELGEVRFVIAITVREDGSQQEYGFGDLTMHEAVGAMAWGASHIGNDARIGDAHG